MAKAKFSLEFKDMLDLADQIDRLGEDKLKRATENALQKSADFANEQVIEAMNSSRYSFNKGQNYSRGQARESAEQVAKTPLKWEGTQASVGVGVSWKDAPEATILAYGTPHLKADTKLKNAIKVKGTVKKQVNEIQKQEFLKVLKNGGLND